MEYEEKKITQTSDPTTEQREYIQTETNYVPVVPEDKGFSGATVAMIVIGAVTAVALLFFLLIYNQRREEENQNRQVETAQQQPQQPIVVQQPAQPIIVQQPSSQPAPIVAPPTSDSTTSSSSANTVDRDLAVQTEIDRRMKADKEFSKLNISATVIDGEVMLVGFVESADMKKRIEKMVKEIKGVKKVNNQIRVSDSGM